MKAMELGQVLNELASGGFVWDQQPAQPMDWGNVRRKRSPSSKTKEYHRERSKQSRRAERLRWLAKGIVKPKDDAERAWLRQQRAEAA